MTKKIAVSEARVLEASWELLSQDGLEKFSMRKLADLIGIQAPSIYWYFKSKQLLFQAMANQVAKEIMLTIHPHGEWKEQLHHYAGTMREQLRIYPCSAQLLMRTLPLESDYLQLLDQFLQPIESLPLTDKEKLNYVLCIINYVLCHELDEYERQQVAVGIGVEDEQLLEDWAIQAFDQIPQEKVSIIRRMYINGLFGEVGTDEMFESGLDILLRGIEQKVIANL
ncbi:TetR/AcrR family transcriptional regulator [Paenibacillus nicotianae]|uniref:TetR/AcrR family transcriptional regulator n=1 Tax=Paenibacillus nicotianae TaxID=1526551 RepID=A0ABW4UXG5_9BACL